MKINFKQSIPDLENVPIPNEKGDPVTLSQVCIEGLLRPHQEDGKLSGEEKLERLKLAKKIKKHDEVEISAEQVTKLKKLVALHFSTLVVGQAVTMLEGEAL